jgi:hypothetical protein
MYILTVSVYTILILEFQYTPHSVLMRTLLLTQSVYFLAHSAGVRISVII